MCNIVLLARVNSDYVHRGIVMKKQLRNVSRLLVALVLVIGASSLFVGCSSLKRIYGFQEIDTSIEWNLVELKSSPQMSSLEKLSEIRDDDAYQIRAYAVKAHVKKDTWYMITAKQRADKIFYIYMDEKNNTKYFDIYQKK